LITCIGTTLGVATHLNNRFSSLQQKVVNLEGEIESIEEKYKEVVLYRINANRELIEHRTNRFQETIKATESILKERGEALRIQNSESETIILGKLKEIDRHLKEVQQFLTKTTEFVVHQKS
jgi:DNA repair exonuclease SbcCD ATPase subunit